MATNYAFANLTSQQERLLREAEETLGGGLLLAYSRTGGAGQGGVPAGVQYSDLTASQVECLEGLEQQLGLVVLAVRPL